MYDKITGRIAKTFLIASTFFTVGFVGGVAAKLHSDEKRAAKETDEKDNVTALRQDGTY